MTKLIIQIPCLNEADSLPETIAALPQRIDGIDIVELLVIDDGSSDGDGQYEGQDIAALFAPILAGQADIVVGDRGVSENAHFSPFKRMLQRMGSNVVQQLANTQVSDAVSGFRAISREAAQRINITTEFSYTTDMLI